MTEATNWVRTRAGQPALGLALALMVTTTAWAARGGPLDAPVSSEPRVPVATVLSAAGFVSSKGTAEPFVRVLPKDTVYSRDLLLVLPGFSAELQPTRSKGVT